MTVEYGGKNADVGTCNPDRGRATSLTLQPVDELKAAGFTTSRSGSALVSVAKSNDVQRPLTSLSTVSPLTSPCLVAVVPAALRRATGSSPRASSFCQQLQGADLGVSFGTNQTTGRQVGKTFDGSPSEHYSLTPSVAAWPFNQADATARSQLCVCGRQVHPGDQRRRPGRHHPASRLRRQGHLPQDGRTATYERPVRSEERHQSSPWSTLSPCGAPSARLSPPAGHLTRTPSTSTARDLTTQQQSYVH